MEAKNIIIKYEPDVIGRIMRQILHGEAQGVLILRKLKKEIIKIEINKIVMPQIESQLIDESRHVKIYSEMLKSGRYGNNHEVDLVFKKVFNKLYELEKDCWFLPIIAVYGVIEPFNYYAIQSLILPSITDNNDKIKIFKILDEEKEHISMFDIFEKNLSRLVSPKEIDICLSYIDFFMEILKDGIDSPFGGKTGFFGHHKWEFIKSIIQIKKRIKRWPN